MRCRFVLSIFMLGCLIQSQLAFATPLPTLHPLMIRLEGAQILDTEGQTWMTEISANGTYVVMTTTLGTVVLGAKSFPGSHAIAKVQGQDVVIPFGHQELIIHSREPVLMGGVEGTVWVAVNPDHVAKASRLQEVIATNHLVQLEQ